MSRTEFTLHHGSDTIGGMIAEVRHGTHRVIFEMGAAYDPRTDPYSAGIQQRNASWLKDALRLGMVPPIDGIFPAAAIEGIDGLISAEESELETIVFITHLHLDHMAFMGAVHPDIPVYLSQNAQTIERALEDTGDGVPTFRDHYTAFTPGEAIRFGEIELLPLLSYDLAYGHSSCLITTPDGSVHWTGDLVMHRPEELPHRLKEIELLRERSIDVLICDCCEFMHADLVDEFRNEDGTLRATLDLPAGWKSEAQMERDRENWLLGATGLVAFNFYQREMAMAELLEELASRYGRTLVFEPDAAWIVHRYFDIAPTVYVPDSTRYAAEPKDPWFIELMDNCTEVTREEIEAAPSQYLLQVSYPNILELFDLPSAGGRFLQIFGIPIGDFDPAWSHLVRVVEQAGFEFVDIGHDMPAGHSSPGAVQYYIEGVAPNILIPAHSFNPERLEAPAGMTRLIPEHGQRFVLKDGQLTPIEP